MDLLLDTHVVVWWLLGSRKLPEGYRRELQRCERAGRPVFVSAFSLWEIAMLVSRGRLEPRVTVDELLSSIENDPLFEVLPLSGRIAAESTRLGSGYHKDPADQIIAATARCHRLKLMTCDDVIRDSGVVAIA